MSFKLLSNKVYKFTISDTAILAMRKLCNYKDPIGTIYKGKLAEHEGTKVMLFMDIDKHVHSVNTTLVKLV